MNEFFFGKDGACTDKLWVLNIGTKFVMVSVHGARDSGDGH